MANPLDHIIPKIIRLAPSLKKSKGEVLFLHGAWMGSWYFKSLAQATAKAGYGANLLNLPSHNPYMWGIPTKTSFKDYVLIAKRAVSFLGKPILITHSLGGLIAQNILKTKDLPVFLICPLLKPGIQWNAIIRLICVNPMIIKNIFLWIPFKLRNHKTLHQSYFLNFPFKKNDKVFLRIRPKLIRTVIDIGLGLIKSYPPIGQYPRIIIAAGRDFFTPPTQLEYLAHKIGAHFIILPGTPHICWQENPKDRVLKLLLEFLNKVIY